MPTKIPYAKETCNASVGCTHSGMPGCDHCWSKDLHDKRHKAYLTGKKVPKQYAKPFGVVQLMPERLERVLRRRKATRYFWCSMSDLFHEDVPFEFISRCFDTMASWRWPNKAAQREGDESQLVDPRHTHLILTKRPERIMPWLHWMDQFWPGDSPFQITRSATGRWPQNIWLGISCSTQDDLDKMAPILFQIPAAHYWLSLEPLLEPVRDHCNAMFPGDPSMARGWVWSEFDWVVIGCESGSKRRPCNIEWVRSVVEQCEVPEIPVYVKQLEINGKVVTDPTDFPEDMRIREIPQ